MAQKIASIYAEIGANTTGFNKGMTSAKASLKYFSDSAKRTNTETAKLAETTGTLKADIGKFSTMLSSATPRNIEYADSFGIIKKNFEDGNITIDQARESINDLTKEMKDGTKAQGAFAGEGVNITKALGLVAIGIGAVVSAAVLMKKVFDFGEAGAQVTRLSDASSQVAKSMGSDMDDIVSAVRSASLNTVSDYDIMEASSRAMMLGVSADAGQLANLMEVAALRGRAMGVSTTQAFNDIVTGIGRMSPLILDNLGIVIDAEARFGDYAKSIGKTKDELTGAEKKQALLNAVLEEGNVLLDKAGGLTKDAASEYEQFDAAIKNLTNTFKENASEGITPVVENMNDMLMAQRAIKEAIDLQVFSEKELMAMEWEVITTGKTYKELLGEINLAIARVTGQFDANTFMARDNRTEFEKLMDGTYDLSKAEEELEGQTEDTAAAQEWLANAMRDARDAAYEEVEAIAALAEKMGEWDAASQYREIKAAAQEWYEQGKITLPGMERMIKEAGIQLEIYTQEHWNESAALEWLSENYTTLGGDLGAYTDAQNLVIDAVSGATWTVGGLADQLRSAGYLATNSAEQTRLMEGVMNQLDLNPAIEETGSLAGNLGYIEGVQGKKIDYTVTTTYITVGSPSPYMGNVPGWGGGGVSDWSNVVERAAGGPLFAGQPSIVGELGPEIFIPNTNGTIIPNNQLGGNVTMYNTFTVPNEATARAVAKELARELNRQGVTA